MTGETGQMVDDRTPSAAPPKGRLKDKVVLVTGSSRGIGRAVAHACAAEGARLAICGRTKEDLLAVSEEVRSLGVPCCAVKIDLSDPDSASRLVDAVHRSYGRIDVLVNNHGILGPRVSLAEYPERDWERVVRTNLTGVFQLTKEVAGEMIPQNSGSIVMVSSSVGRRGKGTWGAYAVTKGAVETMTQVLADDLSTYRIRVNSVNPGATRTRMRAEAYPGEDPNSLRRPAEITNVFVYLASDASRGVTGEPFDAADWVGRTDF